LQREQFLPAIDLLMERLDVVLIDAVVDYLLRLLEQACVYHYPLGPEAERKLAAEFESMASGEGERDVVLTIEQRPVRARRVDGGIAWFDFVELCEGPRGQADYIELAKRFHTVLLSNVPQLKPSKLDAARRFTWLVDEFYDRRVKLVVSAEKPVQELFAVAGGGDVFVQTLNASFVERSVSRLIEMQTHEYLALAHEG
jgi:cell division protein ZapE